MPRESYAIWLLQCSYLALYELKALEVHSVCCPSLAFCFHLWMDNGILPYPNGAYMKRVE
ncbi:hypothetical protein MCC02031_19820 [Bifidobacteriaceae bacterium MCC02031]|nr:hypothetical protein MCC02031_19820 [Bifidobacteriaceae bacterium MCC02031]